MSGFRLGFRAHVREQRHTDLMTKLGAIVSLLVNRNAAIFHLFYLRSLD